VGYGSRVRRFEYEYTTVKNRRRFVFPTPLSRSRHHKGALVLLKNRNKPENTGALGHFLFYYISSGSEYNKTDGAFGTVCSVARIQAILDFRDGKSDRVALVGRDWHRISGWMTQFV